MSTKSFNNVTQDVWDCVKAASISQHSTVYDPPDGNQGTATTNTVVGTVVMEFVFDPTAETVTYTIKSKPMLVPESALWNGIESSVEACINQ